MFRILLLEPRGKIGLYREYAIAIESEARDPNGGNVYYVTMQITFQIPVSRIEFVPESSVYWPIIGLGTRECGVAKRLRDPAVQSLSFSFVSRVSKHLLNVLL